MNKEELIVRLETAHRQLERHIFYFEKKPDGVVRASARPKFNRKEMEAPGVMDHWSLKDLLAHLTEWEQMLSLIHI